MRGDGLAERLGGRKLDEVFILEDVIFVLGEPADRVLDDAR